MNYVPKTPSFDKEMLMSDTGQAVTPMVVTLTAACALKLIDTWSDVSPAYRREFTSALNTACRIIGVPPASLILEPIRLRKELVAKPAAAWGISPNGKSNALTRLRKVLKRLDIIDDPSRELDESWRVLRERLGKYERGALSAFLQFCTYTGVSPSEVTVITLCNFEGWLTTRTLTADPRSMVTGTRRAWNKAASDIEGWPATILRLQSRRGQLLLPFAEFPKSFQDDLAGFAKKLAWKDENAVFGIFGDEMSDGSDDAELSRSEERELSAPLRDITIETKMQHIKMIANALHRADTPLSEIISLKSLVTPHQHARKILVRLWEENGRLPSPKLGHAAEILRQLAKYHANCSSQEVKQIADWAKRLGIRYSGMTMRNQKLLESLTQDRLRRLYELPNALLLKAHTLGACRRAAVLAQRAAMIELLSKCPMRLGNILGLRLDEHLSRPDPKTNAITAIIIPGAQTKNDQDLWFPVSNAFAAVLQIWVYRYRPLIAAPGNPFVFPGRGQCQMTRAGVRDSIKTATEEGIGIAINPHAFRHLAARTFLERYPTAYPSVSKLLGHRSLATTVRTYCPLENRAAAACYDGILQDNRSNLGLIDKHKRRLTGSKALKSRKC